MSKSEIEDQLVKYFPLRTLFSDGSCSEKICRNTLTKDYVLIRRTRKNYILNHCLVNNLDLQVKLFKKADDRCWLRPVEFLQNAEFLYQVYECDENAMNFTDVVATELTEPEIRSFAGQVLSCIESLHILGYYSGALSPKCFVLCGDGILRLSSVMHLKPIEFVKQKERRKTIFHHERHLYMAPELIDSMAQEGPYSDYWMMGVVLYQLYHEKEPFKLEDMESPARLVVLIEYQQADVPADAINFMRGLLRRHYQRAGRQTIQELKKHSYFSKTDWNFSNAMELMEELLVIRDTDKRQTLWRELYFYDIQTSSPRDSIYFPLFKPLPDTAEVAEHLKQQTTFASVKSRMDALLEFRPQNEALGQLWESICL